MDFAPGTLTIPRAIRTLEIIMEHRHLHLVNYACRMIYSNSKYTINSSFFALMNGSVIDEVFYIVIRMSKGMKNLSVIQGGP